MLQLIVRYAVLVFLIPVLMGQTVAVTDCTLIDPRYGVATAHSHHRGPDHSAAQRNRREFPQVRGLCLRLGACRNPLQKFARSNLRRSFLACRVIHENQENARRERVAHRGWRPAFDTPALGPRASAARRPATMIARVDSGGAVARTREGAPRSPLTKAQAVTRRRPRVGPPFRRDRVMPQRGCPSGLPFPTIGRAQEGASCSRPDEFRGAKTSHAAGSRAALDAPGGASGRCDREGGERGRAARTRQLLCSSWLVHLHYLGELFFANYRNHCVATGKADGDQNERPLILRPSQNAG